MSFARNYKGLITVGLLLYLCVLPVDLAAVRFNRSDITGITDQTVRDTFTSTLRAKQLPVDALVNIQGQQLPVQVDYTVDSGLQQSIEELYERYKPDYAAFFAMDAVSGEVVAYADYVKDPNDDVYGHLALNASFPAASVFKVVTAAAALELDGVEPKTVLPYNGKSTSLYKKQVLRHKDNKWTRRPTLTKAFATSINTVFARLGIFQIGADGLRQYAYRFGFNRENVASDMPIPLGVSNIDQDDWVIAEVASGYTDRNTLSPVHGAMIASSVLNDGRISIPFWIRQMTDVNGWPVYIAETRHLDTAVNKDTATKLKVLMRETVTRGSARGAFKRFFNQYDVEVGGKTGSLRGNHPKGRNEWFVGYAQKENSRLAFASVTVSKEKWTVKPAYVARKFIEYYFSKPDK